MVSLEMVPVVPWHPHFFGGTTRYPIFLGIRYVKLDRIVKETDWIQGLLHIFLLISFQFTLHFGFHDWDGAPNLNPQKILRKKDV